MRELMEPAIGKCVRADAKPGVSEACDHHGKSADAVFSQPRYHYQEQADTIKLVVHVPGADPAGIDLEVNVPDLTITAVRNRSSRPPYQSSPRHDYQLRLRLGFNLVYRALQAQLHGGTLTVTIPKRSAVHAVA
jgi:HSP20 family molecular chaperone IbpA